MPVCAQEPTRALLAVTGAPSPDLVTRSAAAELEGAGGWLMVGLAALVVDATVDAVVVDEAVDKVDVLQPMRSAEVKVVRIIKAEMVIILGRTIFIDILPEL